MLPSPAPKVREITLPRPEKPLFDEIDVTIEADEFEDEDEFEDGYGEEEEEEEVHTDDHDSEF